MRRIVIVTAVLMAAASAGAQPWSPPTPTNLRVLPKDTEPRALILMMRGFTQGLGVRCQHCHVYQGDNPDDLTKFDFASDNKVAKQTARTMLRMVPAINTDYLKDVGEARPAGESKVTCYTCHRGETRPLTQRPK